jgi:hypothetical protein
MGRSRTPQYGVGTNYACGRYGHSDSGAVMLKLGAVVDMIDFKIWLSQKTIAIVKCGLKYSDCDEVFDRAKKVLDNGGNVGLIVNDEIRSYLTVTDGAVVMIPISWNDLFMIINDGCE